MPRSRLYSIPEDRLLSEAELREALLRLGMVMCNQGGMRRGYQSVGDIIDFN